MSRSERRKAAAENERQQLLAGLTPEQLATIETLEYFRWTLKFVRRPLFRDPVPVVFHPEGKRFAVIEPDGSINENPAIKLRD